MVTPLNAIVSLPRPVGFDGNQVEVVARVRGNVGANPREYQRFRHHDKRRAGALVEQFARSWIRQCLAGCQGQRCGQQGNRARQPEVVIAHAS